MICQKRVFLLNNVYFDQKISIFVLKYPSLRKRLRNLLNKFLFTTIPKSSCLLYLQPTFPKKLGIFVSLLLSRVPFLR